MGVLNNLYGGDGTIYNISTSGVTGVTENIASGNNLLKPFSGISTYYFDFSDGETKKSIGGCYVTDEKIYIPYEPTLYIISKTAIDASHYACFYCYQNDEYLGYVGFSAATNKTSVKLLDGTNYIRMYINNTSVSTDNFCVSTTELESFEDYAGVDIFKREYIPKMSEKDAIFTNTIQSLKYNPVYGKDILLFGDSIPATASKPLDTATFINQQTGANVYNCAVGGATMGDRHGVDYYNAWSMHRLVNAIVNNDWSVQESNIGRDYEREILAHLKTVDYTKIDSIIIMYGFNDSDIDNADNKLDVNTMGGALRYSIETLSQTYPNIKIYPCTLTYNTNVPTSPVYAEKVQKIKDIAEEYNLKYIDLFNIGINDSTKAHYFNGSDGVHINENGRRLVAKKVAKELF